MKTPIIFDTDAGSDIDDLYALALILQHPNLELLGVTTVTGNTQARARLVAKMLRLAGHNNIPVYAGSPLPLAAKERDIHAPMPTARLTHTSIVEPNDPEYGQTYDAALPFIKKTLLQADTPITIIGTGPWTNIGRLLRESDEELTSKIACISLMGGEVHLNHVESNAQNDPEAVDQVLRSGIPIFLGTWSITRQLYYTMEDIDQLVGPSSSAFLQALKKATDLWFDPRELKKGPVCYDVIPVFWAAGEHEHIKCINLVELPVELEGNLTRGMTVSHPWKVMNAKRTEITEPNAITITDSMDAEWLKQRYTELVFK